MNGIKLNDEIIFPTKIVCVGRNYADHIEELGNKTPREPVVFIKPNSAISANLYCSSVDSIHYEGEMTFLLRGGRIVAVGFGLDLTKREIQSQLKAEGLPWERAKAFDHSAVFSPFVEFHGELSTLSMELCINGKPAQYGHWDLMLYKPDELVEAVNRFLSFEDGDLLMSGTPKGVGEIYAGDVFVGRLFDGDRVLVESRWVAEVGIFDC